MRLMRIASIFIFSLRTRPKLFVSMDLGIGNIVEFTQNLDAKGLIVKILRTKDLQRLPVSVFFILENAACVR